jgi:C1A family cysteine protease
MSRLLVALAALVAVACAFESALLQFQAFEREYEKTYSSAEERDRRFAIFQSNLVLVEELNRKNGEPAFGVTKFMDMTPEEFRAAYLMNITHNDLPKPPHANYKIDVPKPAAVPTTFDWGVNATGIVTPVKNQASCGSCWAFSATETTESVWARAGNSLQVLAPQQIVDCDTVDLGCEGGWPYRAYQYLIQAGGFMSEADYPYTGRDGKCTYSYGKSVAKISGWKFINTDPTTEESVMLPYLLNNSPLSICVDASSWQFYSGGILQTCGSSIDHCVQLTGFGVMLNKQNNPVNVWNVRNSWATNWGSKGYIYIARGSNLCELATVVTVPVV